jgi:hypothetical protein
MERKPAASYQAMRLMPPRWQEAHRKFSIMNFEA